MERRFIWLGSLVLGFCLAVWLGTGYVAWVRLRSRRCHRAAPALATEAVILTGLLFASTGLGVLLPSRGAGGAAGGLAVQGGGQGAPELLWTFRLPRKGGISSTPLVVGDRVYVSAAHDRTGSHTESTPWAADGRVFCGAGDDGLYCLTAEKGEKVWGFPSFHIDAPPLVAGDRVLAGCGIGDVYTRTALFCLDLEKGQPRWRVNTDLAVWARPTLARGQVFFGTGNGRLNQADEVNPASSVPVSPLSVATQGGVLCALAPDSGQPLWTLGLSEQASVAVEVVGSPVLGEARRDREGRRLYVAATLVSTGRTGELYCFEERQ
jgi:outer membrane protein assembly factor BamB